VKFLEKSMIVLYNSIMYPRSLNLPALLAESSYFLFGPRQTGKSTLVSEQLSDSALLIDLLDTDLLLQLSARPGRLREICEQAEPEKGIIVIDEIQKIPSLLDEVHFLIEKKKLRFLLTGSSARSLRRGGVNLLGGRAREMSLHPLTWFELRGDFNLNKALTYGTLPSIVNSIQPERDLQAYTSLYLTQEIQSEGYVRNLPAFSRFLEVAALSNAELINYTKIGNDADVSPNTVREHFQILRDTLLGRDLEPWRKSKRRKPVATSKFYFFDIGVTRALQGRKGKIEPRSPEFGKALESYIAHELLAYSSYKHLSPPRFWRTVGGIEVDFLLGDLAVEVKASERISKGDLKGLKALREEGTHKTFILVGLEKLPRVVDGIQILPLENFLEKLWADRMELSEV